MRRGLIRLRFDHPMALPYTSKWVRMRFLFAHYCLGLGFLMGPMFVVTAAALASVLLLLETFSSKKTFTKAPVLFGWQRAALSAIVALVFLGLAANSNPLTEHWWWVSFLLMGLCFYDGYLAYRGVTGLFYLKLRE